MKPRNKRLAIITVGVVGLTVATLLVLDAFRSNLVFFYSPSEVIEGKAPKEQTFRLGGMVEQGSVKREGLRVSFIVTDFNQKVPVRYEGQLPDLFREGQGVVAQGKFSGGQFVASNVLAKHDEKYMPPEAAKAIEGGTYKAGKDTKTP